jgi:U1 small nuclear ribonucleoprotein
MGDYGNAMMRNQDAGVQSRVKAQSRANLLQLKLVSLLRLRRAPPKP